MKGKVMTVMHTEVLEEEEGKGYAKQLFNEMVKHARANKLMVSVVCPYVRAQFMRHQDQFSDIWKRDED
jgi:predicted GNAT family acetyltransferase